VVGVVVLVVGVFVVCLVVPEGVGGVGGRSDGATSIRFKNVKYTFATFGYRFERFLTTYTYK
jgi:hypothetical protein